MLLVVATGLLFGFWMEPASAAVWTCGMLCIHAAIIRNCVRFLAGLATVDADLRNGERGLCCSISFYGTGWIAILIHPAGVDAVSNTADDVPDAAGDRGLEHTGGSLPIAARAATAPVRWRSR